MSTSRGVATSLSVSLTVLQPHCHSRGSTTSMLVTKGTWLHHPTPLLLFLRKATQLRSLATRPVKAKGPVVHVVLATGKVNGSHKKKLRTYLGIVAHDKGMLHMIIGSNIQFEDKEKKILQSIGKWWRQFKSDLTSKWALVHGKEGEDDKVCEKYDISKEKWNQFCQNRRDPSWEEAAQSRSTDIIVDPPSPIRRHMKWKMVCMKKSGFTKRVGFTVKLCRRWTSGCTNCYNWATRAPWSGSHTSSSMALEDLEQLKQKIRNQVEESITQKVTQQLMLSFSQMQSQAEGCPSVARVSTKESCVDPSRQDPETSDLDKYGLYVSENPPRLVSLGSVYKGSTTIHNLPLGNDQVKVGVEEVRDADACISIPTQEVQLVGQKLNTFLAWLTHLVKPFLEHDKQEAEGPTKLVDRPDPDVHPLPDDIGHPVAFSLSRCRCCGMLPCLSNRHMIETSMLAGNVDNSRRDVYLGAYLNGFNDSQGSKSKAAARWIVVKCNNKKGSTECGYYVMNWMSTIVLGDFKDNWETYFTGQRPLEPERMMTIRIQ
ncbi:hypothetical protein HKD37_15G042993 [Glycine soja]